MRCCALPCFSTLVCCASNCNCTILRALAGKLTLQCLRVAKRRFWPEAPRRPRAAAEDLAADTDTRLDLLPAASELSAGLRAWLKRGSWGQCPKCAIPQARPTHEAELAHNRPPHLWLSECKSCVKSRMRKAYAPKPDDAPREIAWLHRGGHAGL